MDVLLKAGPVRCAAVDAEYAHLVTAGDDKRLKVWALDSLQLLSERCATTSPPFLPRHENDNDAQRNPQKTVADCAHAFGSYDPRRGQVRRCLQVRLQFSAATRLSLPQRTPFPCSCAPKLPADAAAHTHATARPGRRPSRVSRKPIGRNAHPGTHIPFDRLRPFARREAHHHRGPRRAHSRELVPARSHDRKFLSRAQKVSKTILTLTLPLSSLRSSSQPISRAGLSRRYTSRDIRSRTTS